MKKYKYLLIIIIVVVAVQLLINWQYRRNFMQFPRSPKMQICEELKPGITISDMEKTLGIPINKKVTEKGVVWFSYAADQYASVLIKARIDQDTGLVLELHCGEGPPNWVINPDALEK